MQARARWISAALLVVMLPTSTEVLALRKSFPALKSTAPAYLMGPPQPFDARAVRPLDALDFRTDRSTDHTWQTQPGFAASLKAWYPDAKPHEPAELKALARPLESKVLYATVMWMRMLVSAQILTSRLEELARLGDRAEYRWLLETGLAYRRDLMRGYWTDSVRWNTSIGLHVEALLLQHVRAHGVKAATTAAELDALREIFERDAAEERRIPTVVPKPVPDAELLSFFDLAPYAKRVARERADTLAVLAKALRQMRP